MKVFPFVFLALFFYPAFSTVSYPLRRSVSLEQRFHQTIFPQKQLPKYNCLPTFWWFGIDLKL